MHPSSLPGLTPQVGSTRLAAHNIAQLVQALSKPKDGANATDNSDAPVLDLAFDGTNPKTGPTPIVEDGVSFQSGDGAVFSTTAQYLHFSSLNVDDQ